MAILDLNTIFGFWPRARLELSVDVLLEAMQARQVTRSVAFSAKALFYDAGEGNDDTATVCASRPELIPAAVIDPRCYPQCLDEARKRREQGFRVFRFFPDLHEYPVDFSPLEAVLPELSGCLAVFSTGRPGAATALARRTSEGVTLSLDPCGAETLGEALAAMSAAPALYLETTSLLAAGALEAAVGTAGADRLLFGSGAPLRALSSALMTVQLADLSDADRTALLGDNLARLLGQAVGSGSGGVE
jgi:predicted TIM-barrel fold metal-dependent hydrolase